MTSDDNVTEMPLTERDQEDLETMLEGGDVPTFHPVLMAWREVLKPAADEAEKPVTPQWANRMVSKFQQFRFSDMNEFRDRFYGKILELARVLDEEIATDEDCLSYTTPEEDAENNSQHYKNLLMDWQKLFLTWEMAWDTTDEFAHVELAAIGETHDMFFGPNGITAFLDNIKFEYTEADQAELGQALLELREGQ